MSLNPDTREEEWVKIITTMKYKYNGRLIHLNMGGLDLLVTPDHKIIYLDRNNGKIESKKASDFTINDGYFFNDNSSAYATNRGKNRYHDFKKFALDKRKNRLKLHKEEIDYNGYVYDVEVEKNHIISISRNCGTLWGSNCICYATYNRISKEKFVEYIKTGKIDKRQFTRAIPQRAKRYVKKNGKRFQGYKSVPYWLEDNFTKDLKLRKFVQTPLMDKPISMSSPNPITTEAIIPESLSGYKDILMAKEKYNVLARKMQKKYTTSLMYQNMTEVELELLLKLDNNYGLKKKLLITKTKELEKIVVEKGIRTPIRELPSIKDTHENIAKYIKSVIDNDGDFNTFGIRAMTDLSDVFQPRYLKSQGISYKYKTPKIGDKLERSWTWIDGQITNEKLNGVSSLGINAKDSVETIAKKLDLLKRHYYGRDRVFIRGIDYMEGVDAGEYIIQGAEVLFRWK